MTIGTLLESFVLSISTAFFAAGLVVVIEVVVEVTVGVTSSHSNESHGHPAGQLSFIHILNFLSNSWTTLYAHRTLD